MAGGSPTAVRALPELLAALPAVRRAVRRICAPNVLHNEPKGAGMKYRQAMDSTLDVLTFLAYAAMLGLCIGALLGGLALVLSAPAHAASDAAANLLLRHAGGEAAAAPLVSTDTVFQSDGPIQRVRI